ncbi:MAG: amidohydrolase family protein [Candidatus Bathyarchaeia archaeon]
MSQDNKRRLGMSVENERVEDYFGEKYYTSFERSSTSVYMLSLDGTRQYKVIDTHTHSYNEQSIKWTEGWGFCVYFDGTSEELIKSMDVTGIYKSVIVPYGSDELRALNQDYGSLADARRVNDQIARAVDRRPDRLIGFADIPHLRGHEVLDEIDRAVSVLRLKGIGHFSLEPVDVTAEIVEKAAELRVPIDVGASSLYTVLGEVAPSYPEVRFKGSNFCHARLHVKSLVDRASKVLTSNANVWADISMALAQQPEKCIAVMKDVGFDKFVYGSDFPVLGYVPEHELNLLFRHAEIEKVSPEDLDKVLCGNAEKFLGLSTTT